MGGTWIFIGLVFLAVFLLTQGMVIPVFGEARKMRKRLLTRLNTVASSMPHSELASLLRQKYLKELSPLERTLEELPAMEALSRMIEQSGRTTPAYRVVLLSVVLAFGACIVTWIMSRMWHLSLLIGLFAFALPFLKIAYERAQRMAKFEEQMPEALDVIKRALKAGHPFSQAMKLVAEDMPEPVSKEFDMVFAEINYGSDVRRAMMGLLERMPSVSTMALITAVLVQKETGGNLAETLERISVVIRGRFKLYRRIRTLSAEGRLSAWILAMVPLVLFAIITFTTPDYLPVLVKNPMGKNLIFAAAVLGTLGILWIRRVIRIQV
jgi:tight adherence protein B